ncbi:MAG: Bacterio-opsin linked product [Parcubacteria group bacterium GW2011_GWA1_38_7]|nr:MAG: Bacterio-opsin linked product [Parcubacteria group bacterium GW2011_GWA1_38_7]
MSKVTSSILINKPIEQVFDFAASPINGPKFIPNLSENTNINPEESGVGQTFDWHFNMFGLSLNGKAKITEFKKPDKAVIETDGNNKTTWTYSFDKEGSGTKVTVEIDYELHEDILRKFVDKMVIDKMNQRSADQMMENLKTILEAES